jgi:hypothetical protein
VVGSKRGKINLVELGESSSSLEGYDKQLSCFVHQRQFTYVFVFNHPPPSILRILLWLDNNFTFCEINVVYCNIRHALLLVKSHFEQQVPFNRSLVIFGIVTIVITLL